jgi:probable F420-dependent oxidoreductase
MPTPFRFAVQAHTASTKAEWIDQCRKAEDLGYSTISLPDHFGNQLAPVPALMAAADATTTLRIGTLVFDNDYKHPVVLAKECATLDLLSEGRLELGIGAGWMVSDYEQSGIPYDSPGVRIDRMVEGIHILRGLFAPGPFSFHGAHYSISGLDGFPKPFTPAGPPILVGGGGKRVLTLAGQLADIVGINANLRAGVIGPDAGQDAVPSNIDQKLEWVKAGAGDRFGDLEIQIRVHLVHVTDDRNGFAELFAGGFGISTEDALGTPLALIGTHEQIIETVLERRERWGMSYLTLDARYMDEFAPIVAALAGK